MPNGWRNWIAHSTAPAWIRCGSRPPNRSRPCCNGSLRSAGEGGEGEVNMNMNIQHPTSNIQRSRAWRRGRCVIGCWVLDGGCWMFLSLALFALSLSAQISRTNALPPLAPAYGEIPPTFRERHGTAMLVAGSILIALAGAVVWIILRPQPPVLVPPQVLARETLAKLRRQPENGQVLSEI